MNIFLESIRRCVAEGMQRLSNKEADFNNIEVLLWKQTWGDTSCGFGGMAGQAITDAYTLVIIDELKQECVVFHNFKFAYQTEIDYEIAKRITHRNLLGAYDFNRKIKK